MKVHIASAQMGGTRYICNLKNCNFETHSKRYLVKHMNKCKLQDSESVATIESVSGDIMETSSREGDKSEESEKSLCNIPGCDFISFGGNEVERRDHFQVEHRDSELRENSFILINSAMAEALEILREIKKENNSVKNES